MAPAPEPRRILSRYVKGKGGGTSSVRTARSDPRWATKGLKYKRSVVAAGTRKRGEGKCGVERNLNAE